MAYDKVVDSAFLEAGLTLVGDSIRAKGGTSAKLEFPNGMKAAVEAIDTSEDLDDVLDEQESIIDQIQAALEGKAAASVETCTVQITQSEIPSDVYYVDGNLSIQFTNSASVIEVLKNNILVTNAMYVKIISGGASYITMEGSYGKYGVMITGDASISLHI